ncbi:response regulator transcription factor [Methylibium petroleiphilum]|uniref:response regulator transcription factor n=1 Tax=Methylibium petroleiphilum TaxID=105560 RepID=UPI001AC6053A|nr:response regulator transcription factor [Methylibium petroleiphilum]MBN9205699.1 response regulator transcription factor [Methylibium petroleiphilum]
MDSRPEPSRPEAARPVVLVVDDAPSSLGMLCDTLEDAGYTVLIARDGEAALQRLRLVVPDVILLDAMMPGMSGFETCRALKADPALTHIPVIFMTGLSETAHVVEGFACGGVDYVVKPIRAPEVLARLHTHARNARITRLAREAVDVAGLGVLLVDAHGRIAWRSPQAERWLAACGAGGPGDMIAPAEAGTERVFQMPGPLAPQCLTLRSLGPAGMGETMWLLEVQRGDGSDGAASPSRLSAAALTPRETEVLSWLAKGKTNRDIGDILGVSPRTVNKHLEHIFEKLGVETRAAAAALASTQWGGD